MAVYVTEYDWMWLPTGLNLSPAECRVYAYIYGLTKSKHAKTKGYNGSVRQLAKDLGLDATGVSRVLRKLQDDKRITSANGVFRSVDIFHTSVDSVHTGVDSVYESVDSVRSPLTTPLYNNIKERENIAREDNSDAPLSLQGDFFLVTLAAFSLQAGARNVTPNQEQNAKTAWQRYTPEQQRALYYAVRKGYNVKGNFQFTVEDFLEYLSKQAAEHPPEQPTNYNGCDPPKEPTAVAFYNGEWGLYTLADIQKFNLPTKNSKQ